MYGIENVEFKYRIENALFKIISLVIRDMSKLAMKAKAGRFLSIKTARNFGSLFRILCMPFTNVIDLCVLDIV